MADSSGLVVVFNNIRIKPQLPALFLGLKARLFVLLPCHRPAVVPSLGTGAHGHLTEIKHTGKISVLPDKGRQLLRLVIKYLPHGKGMMLLKGLLLHLSQKLPDALRMGQHDSRICQAVGPVRRVILHGQGLFDINDGIQAEAGHALFQPPVDHLINFLTHLGIFPV